MKKIGLIMSVLALCGGSAFSQSQMDAFKYTQSDLIGTARYMSMGGAFGALGGDISVMSNNPAGLAVYRSSEVVTTLSLSSVSAKANWLGANVDNSRTKFNFDNIAYVGYFPTANDEGIVSWNAGFSYNRLKNFSRNYTMSSGDGNMHTSLSDYIAARANGIPSNLLAEGEGYNPYNPEQSGLSDWLPILGYNAGYMDSFNDNDKSYYSSFGDVNSMGEWEPYLLQGGKLNVSERGAIDQYNLSFGMNISDLVLLGATVAITDLNYRYTSSYDEAFTNGNNLYLDNSLNTDGTGYSFNIGAIFKPVDFFRVGVAYNSPKWYKMTDHFYAEAGSHLTFMEDGVVKERNLDAFTPEGSYYNYEYRSPDKWIFSAAAILGKVGLISIDYEMMNYKNMRMYETDGSSNIFTNEDIKKSFKFGNTVRVGTEFKVTPQFAVRAGIAYSDSPYKDMMKEGKQEVFSVGTTPNYLVDKGVTHYTFGLGYRFTPNFYTDLACVYRTHKEDVYPFSSMYDSASPDPFIQAQPASLKTNTTKVSLTFGFKF